MNNLKRISLVMSPLIALLVAGCEIKIDEKTSPRDYTCTPEQLNQVEREYLLCKESGYMGTFCFAQAKATICDHTATDKPIGK